jgi:hypothetical protein
VPTVQIIVDGRVVVDQDVSSVKTTTFTPQGWSDAPDSHGETLCRIFIGPPDTIHDAINDYLKG